MTIRTYLGLDIGKTKIAAGIVDGDGKVLKSTIRQTDLSDNGKNILTQCRTMLAEVSRDAGRRICGIGVGTIGIVDQDRGRIVRKARLWS